MIVCPGDELPPGDEQTTTSCGQGVFTSQKRTFASILGRPESSENVIAVRSSLSKSSYSAIPSVGSIVIARVLSLAGTHVTCEVLISGDHQLSTPFHGVIRREHIRETEIDKMRIDDMFRPGDLVQAVVASLGDSRNLFLSTINDAHGVIFARSSEGNSMVHDSPGVMRDQITGLREKRKNALR